MSRFEAYAESYVWDKKFEEVLTRDEAIELMNDMARELENERKENPHGYCSNVDHDLYILPADNSSRAR